MSNGGDKIQYLDTLRAMAAVGVVVIHLTSALLNMTWIKNMPYWWVGNVVESLVRFSVPVFLMLSGATMLGREYVLKDYYKRRLLRVLVPFVFWMLAYWVFRWLMLKPAVRPSDFTGIMGWAVDLFLNEGISKHFWYVYMILFIYLFLPFVGKYLRRVNKRYLLVAIALWVVALFFVQKIPFNTYRWTGDYGSKLLCYLTYSGYLLLGYFLTTIDTQRYKIRPVSVAVFACTVLVAAVGTRLLSGPKMNLSLYGNLTLNTILQSVSLFLLLKDTVITNSHVQKIVNTLSAYSYGIYLVHIMVIGVLFHYGIYWSFAHPVVSIPVLTVGVTTLSFGIIYLIRKIPGGRYVAG
ncbi:MAG: acyltransferase 3 [Bacteroidetes bacterium]|jgi:surface polysaccharide O-acyltransferase-like enzyme|nr:acyltransferase 3 [Bacteroidota bacterium]